MSIADIIAQAIRVADGNHTLGAGALAEAIVADLDRAGYVVRKKPRTRATAAPVEAYAPNTGDPAVDEFMRRKHNPKWKPLAMPRSPGLPALRPMKVSEMDAAEQAWLDECKSAARIIGEGNPSPVEEHLRSLIALHRPDWRRSGRDEAGRPLHVHRDDDGVQIVEVTQKSSSAWVRDTTSYHVVTDGTPDTTPHYAFEAAIEAAEKIIANRAERITQ